MKYPSKKNIKKIINSLSDDDYVEILASDANRVDKLKYSLCKKFVSYLLKEKISQAELARILNIDRSRVNWIVKYKIQYFTIDRLYELLEILDPSIELRVS